jgi:two-component system phosphate regulon sensor histidine kinase PhoR
MMSNIQDDVLLEFTASHFGQGEVVLVINDVSRLDKLERLRTEFVGNVSHELRTPLTVIRGYLETLQDIPKNTAMENKAYYQMSEQVTRMQALAEDLILLSRLEEEVGNSVLEEFDLADLLKTIVIEAEALSEGQHIISFDAISTPVRANQKDIRGALGNIIFNAVKHNPTGANIEIKIEAKESGFFVTIADDGIGIDPLEIPRLTERFYRGDNSRNSQTGGSGLGLAIAKHALTQAGGSLTITSRLGKGSKFECWLPTDKD